MEELVKFLHYQYTHTILKNRLI